MTCWSNSSTFPQFLLVALCHEACVCVCVCVFPFRLSLQLRSGKWLPICWKYGLHSKYLTCIFYLFVFTFSFSFLCLLPCIFVLFFVYLQCLCIHQHCAASSVLSPVNLVSSSQSVSSPHLSISSLCSLLHLTLSLSFYSLQSHVNVRGVYLLRYVSVGVLSILTDIAEFTV